MDDRDQNQGDGEQMPLLTQQEVADRWSLSARTLEAWRWRGVGVAWLRIGRCVRYRLADVQAYESQRRQKPIADSAAIPDRERA